MGRDVWLGQAARHTRGTTFRQYEQALKSELDDFTKVALKPSVNLHIEIQH
jgi:putative IMPACT (imprinted ancient) family translation regulator